MAANSGGGRGIGCTIYGRGDRESLEGEWNGRIGRLLSASYLTASLPAIYTDEPLETIAMQRSNTSSNAIAAPGKQYKDTLQLTVILYHLEGNGAACVQSSKYYIHAPKNISALSIVFKRMLYGKYYPHCSLIGFQGS